MNVREAEWWFTDSRGARCSFESEYGDPQVEFDQLGINLSVLEPGQTSMHHSEANQEGFLVLSGECTLIVEGEERRLRSWDFFHSPRWTEHAFVGAGECPCVILMAGARSRPGGAVPRVRARGTVRRMCGRGDVRPGTGVRERRVVPATAAAVLEPPPLGVARTLLRYVGGVLPRADTKEVLMSVYAIAHVGEIH